MILSSAVKHKFRAEEAPNTAEKERGGKRVFRRIEIMANHKSAIKRIRQNEKRRLHNRAFRNRARTLVRKAREAIASGDVEAAQKATLIAARDLDKLASRGVVHKRNAARRKSRLVKQMMALYN